MPGRLEQYDDFIEKAQYNVTEKKPLIQYKNDDDKKQKQKKVEDKLQGSNTDLVFQMSKKHHFICIVFLKKGYRFVVIPEKRLAFKKNPRIYIEVIDVKKMQRKTYRRDRIVKAKLTNKKFEAIQDVIKFPEK